MVNVYARPVAASDARELHICAYELLFAALESDYGCSRRDLDLRKDENGKPFFANSTLQFSISHTDGLVVVAIGNCAVGVDCEMCSRVISDRVAMRFLGQQQATVADWTSYEALGKMLGCGIPLSKFEADEQHHTMFYHTLAGYTVCCVSKDEKISDQLKLY